jgi:hypothetical protein
MITENLSRLINFPSTDDPSANLKLRQWMEEQLITDLRYYGVTKSVRIDWSQSYGCGRKAKYLGGKLENLSRLIVFDEDDNLIADGCMDFISNDFFAICYWDLLTVWRHGETTHEKKEQGIPPHIWRQLPGALTSRYSSRRI